MSRPSPQVRSTFISSIFTWSVDLCCQSCWVQQDSNCLLTRIRNARKSWSQMLPASNPGFCKEPSIGQTRPSWRNIWRKHSLQVQTIQHWQSLSCVSTAYLQHTVWWVTSWFWMFWPSRSQSNSDSVWLGGRWQHQFPETHVSHEITARSQECRITIVCFGIHICRVVQEHLYHLCIPGTTDVSHGSLFQSF